MSNDDKFIAVKHLRTFLNKLKDLFATKKDTVLTTTLSRGRDVSSTVGVASFAFGSGVEASGSYSHAEGGATHAKGNYSHAEGNGTHAIGESSHAEGLQTRANRYSHAEGIRTCSASSNSHVQGEGTVSADSIQNVSGKYNYPIYKNDDIPMLWSPSESYSVGDFVLFYNECYVCIIDTGPRPTFDKNFFVKCNRISNESAKVIDIIGNGLSNTNRKNIQILDENGNEYLAGNLYVNASSPDCLDGVPVATATDTVLNTTLSRGRESGTTSGIGSFAFGNRVEASGDFSHAEGIETKATGNYSYAEGNRTEASGLYAHTEGYNTKASGELSHAEGRNNHAEGKSSHAEGNSCKSIGSYSSVKGISNITAGTGQFSFGKRCLPVVDSDELNKLQTWNSSESYSIGTLVKKNDMPYVKNTTIQGLDFVNSFDHCFMGENVLEIVGNGDTSLDETIQYRKNARMLLENGNEYLAGNLYVNATLDNGIDLDNNTIPGHKVATETMVKYTVDNLIIMTDITIPVPSNNNETTIYINGLTGDHQLLKWNFNNHTENNSPVTLSVVSIGSGAFTFKKTSGTTPSGETIQPLFVYPYYASTSTSAPTRP